MIRSPEPGGVVLLDGRPAHVVGVAEGRTVILEHFDEETCRQCGIRRRAYMLEDSANFQERVRPVPTARDHAPWGAIAVTVDDVTWFHLDGTQCVAGWDSATGYCSEGGGPVTPRLVRP